MKRRRTGVDRCYTMRRMDTNRDLGAWVTTAWTVVMDDQTERTVYAKDREQAMELVQRALRRRDSDVPVLDAYAWGRA